MLTTVHHVVFVMAMAVLFRVDLKERRLPNLITLPGIALGFALSFFMAPGWRQSLLGILVGGGGSWLMATLWFYLRGEEGMGLGDVKMLAMIGAFLGLPVMLAVFVFATFTGALVGLGLIILRKGDMKTGLPFGCFLALAAIAGTVVGQDVVAWYVSLRPFALPSALSPQP
jgi:leader peptidase (prepilin peptidase)/N-methyltransferase